MKMTLHLLKCRRECTLISIHWSIGVRVMRHPVGLKTLRKVLWAVMQFFEEMTYQHPPTLHHPLKGFSGWRNDPSQEHQFEIIIVSEDHPSNLPGDCNGFWSIAAERRGPGCRVHNYRWSFCSLAHSRTVEGQRINRLQRRLHQSAWTRSEVLDTPIGGPSTSKE